MEAALSIRDLTKRYGDFTAVENLSVAVPRGAVYGILGPNGAGKSTTLRMIMNIIGRDSGTIAVLGTDPAEDRTILRVGRTTMIGTLEGINTGGLGADVTPIDEMTMVSNVWTIVARHTTFTVRGVEYLDVVEVTHDASIANPLTGALEPTTITYWVARGIGMIRATNLVNLFGVRPVWELIETNLVRQ